MDYVLKNEEGTFRMPASKPTRRQFLEFLAASPLMAGLPVHALAGDSRDPALAPLPDELFGLIDAPADALDVFDLHRVARKTLPSAHYGYLATGTDGNETLRANRTAFERLVLRARRLVDTSDIDTRLQLLGESLPSPIVVAPAGSQQAFHADGELATARGARARDHLQILSNVTTVSVEEVNEARGRPVWMQLYPTQDFEVARAIVTRAERAGCRVLVLTVDLDAGSNRDALSRFMRADDRDCSACHDMERDDYWLDRKPMYFETGVDAKLFDTPEMTWDYLDRLRSITGMKLVVKGIVTGEDAVEAVRRGVDAVYVSNHGGRAEASGWGTIESLPEVVKAVDGAVPVMVDSGFRRGTDIFKALALGADAIAIGRPYLWGLAAFGQEGVETVIDILSRELEIVMRQAGVTALQQIDSRYLA